MIDRTDFQRGNRGTLRVGWVTSAWQVELQSGPALASRRMPGSATYSGTFPGIRGDSGFHQVRMRPRRTYLCDARRGCGKRGSIAWVGTLRLFSESSGSHRRCAAGFWGKGGRCGFWNESVRNPDRH